MTGGKQIHLEDVGVMRKAISHDKSEHEENQAHAGNQADRPAESTAKPAKSTEKNTPSERMSPSEQAGPEAKRQKAEEAPAAAKGGDRETGADHSKGSQLEPPPKGKHARLLHVLFLAKQPLCPPTCYVSDSLNEPRVHVSALQKSSSRARLCFSTAHVCRSLTLRAWMTFKGAP